RRGPGARGQRSLRRLRRRSAGAALEVARAQGWGNVRHQRRGAQARPAGGDGTAGARRAPGRGRPATGRGWIAMARRAGTGPGEEIADRIVGAALNRRGAIGFLETLTDTVGGRVTGSPESRAASELILKTLREAGFANARLEEYSFAAGWRRGPAAARVTS